ncbi:heme exporter protein CcmB [Megalodesulfovibrio gigas]|uniref:Putative heme exporter protein B n=1 Tax=Megalodesulfovibrio gigas (strain ATCC 19364 / DSM 1382 / NCIMB 9332 / VKM B-1759) TaxID=1121448 RepID=T2GCW0_MEGG1|nr:heme exporter protein CcmB [Megalodesulfovibrio gigas]AGW13966.1 putative heme exporter protein B [Megalodesulfovibrio gigas DSM 1382 = ATCC 19364]
MLRAALVIAHKDLRLLAGRSSGLVQAILLGLVLLFLFSLSQAPGQRLPAQSAAAVFWMASLFCEILVVNALFFVEEVQGARLALALSPMPLQAVWLGKVLASLVLLLLAQCLFLPASVAFLGQSFSGDVLPALAMVLLADWGLVALGALLGALSQGQAARESLLSVVLFPLLLPLLLAAVRGMTQALGGPPESLDNWFLTAGAFDLMFTAAALFLFPFVYGGDA